MQITMIKKRLASGDPCQKCAQTEDMLRRRGHWDSIDEVIWAVEGEPDSPGWAFAKRHEIEVAPFFVIEIDGEETALTSPLRLIKKYFEAPTEKPKAAPTDAASVDAWAVELADASPQRVLEATLDRFGDRAAIATSGGLDVVLLEMAAQIGKPFRVFTIDTGRLHQETYAHLDDVRRRYGVEIEVFLPDTAAVMELSSRSGTNSFLRDGHVECCAVRQRRPLSRALAGRNAWVTGRTAAGARGSASPLVELDTESASDRSDLVRVNPLARWSHEQVLAYAREHAVPMHPLLEQGYPVIGCAPCTRPIGPDDPPRSVRWWWEDQAAPDGGAVAGGGDGI